MAKKATRADIERKWMQKLRDMEKQAERKYKNMEIQQLKKLNDTAERIKSRIERKHRAFVNKKTTEYKRKMANEIRKLEGKEERVYKEKKKTLNLREFAMAIAQENARLRDTDADGYGYCISCNKYCSWGMLAGGHRHSRGIQNICLDEKNINAQCSTCNFITGPMGSVDRKSVTNMHYDENLDIKYGKGTAKRLQNKADEWYKSYHDKYDYRKEIPLLIVKNKRLWRTKNFYTPSKDWEKIWNRYVVENPIVDRDIDQKKA